MPLQQRSAATRARILEAAEASFARYGYDAASVAEICRRAGVGKGGFYHHFPSKQVLFLELLNRWLAGLEAQLAAQRAEGRSVPQVLLAMSAALPHVFQAAEGQLPLFLEFLAQAARDPAAWKATAAPYQRYRRFFAGLIETGISEGSLRRVDASLAAYVLVSLAVGILLQGLLEHQPAAAARRAPAAVRLLLEGLQRNV